MGHFVYNDKFLKEGTAVIGPANRGLRYGDGIFETIKMTKGKLMLEDAHFARLWKGMNVLGFDIPKHFTPEKLSAAALALAQKNGHERLARIRLQVLRGDGGLYNAISHTPNYIIETWGLPETNDMLNSNGLELGIYTAAKKCCDILAELKHNNYLPYCMAALHAKKEKWNDALLLNDKGYICDSTIANVFLIKNEHFFTPSIHEGCVGGTMRAHLIQFLKTAGWDITETAISIDDLHAADEVFLTNSIYNIRWVKSIGSTHFSNDITQKIYSRFLPTIE